MQEWAPVPKCFHSQHTQITLGWSRAWIQSTLDRSTFNEEHTWGSPWLCFFHLRLFNLSCWFSLPWVWCSGTQVGDGQNCKASSLCRWTSISRNLVLLCARTISNLCMNTGSETCQENTCKMETCFETPQKPHVLSIRACNTAHQSQGWIRAHLFQWSSAVGEFNPMSQSVTRNVIIWKFYEGREGQTCWIIYSLLIFPEAVIEVLF